MGPNFFVPSLNVRPEAFSLIPPLSSSPNALDFPLPIQNSRVRVSVWRERGSLLPSQRTGKPGVPPARRHLLAFVAAPGQGTAIRPVFYVSSRRDPLCSPHSLSRQGAFGGASSVHYTPSQGQLRPRVLRLRDRARGGRYVTYQGRQRQASSTAIKHKSACQCI
jgi:hypothetical protein